MIAENKYVWTNWSEDIRFVPGEVYYPSHESEVQQIVDRAVRQKQTIRAIGARHSCSAIFETNQILLVLEKFKGLHEFNTANQWATLGAATTVEEAGESLFQVGLGMENTGHINKQALSGAISTGTHGAGKKLTNLSGQVVGVRIVTGTGEVKDFTVDSHPEIMQALKVSLGSMGIFTQVTIKALPAFQLHRRQYCCSVDDCMEHLPELLEENRNFCFYWYPRRDDVSLRLWNPLGEGTQHLPYAKLYKAFTGWGRDVLPTEHHLKYNELEYCFDLETAPYCFQEVRKRIKEKHRKHVAWRVLYRPVGRDNAFLSTAYEKDIIAITLHQNAALPYNTYFDDIEKIFQAFGGRPHWGKKHSLTAAQLKSLYPMWERFHEIRMAFDPNGIFLNSYLNSVFIES